MVRDTSSMPGLQRGRRASARLRLRLPARMVLRDGTQPCVLTDLSSGGARILLSECVRVGDEAVLMWGSGLEAFGEIIWFNGRHCGIVFEEPLAATLLQATRDLDATERLPADRELVRGSADAFVRGAVRL